MRITQCCQLQALPDAQHCNSTHILQATALQQQMDMLIYCVMLLLHDDKQYHGPLSRHSRFNIVKKQ